MLKNYVKIAWRNIVTHSFYSFVSVAGLSTGIAFTLLIAAYVWGECRVNADLKHEDRQYIIQSKWKDPNTGFSLSTLGPLAKALKDNYPGLVANYYRWDGISSNVSKGNKSFRENIAICDSTFFSMYGFKLLQGDAGTALKHPFSVVITADKAVKYFGSTDVVGQTITIGSFSGSKHDFLITGVLTKLPRNSVTQLVDDYPNDLFISTDNLNFFGRNMDWTNPNIAGYLELQKGVTAKDLEKPMMSLIKENAPSNISAVLTPFIISLDDYYRSANNGIVNKMIYALSSIALFILMMAIVNFVNMSVGRSSSRMKEIGIRKVLGGVRRQLMIQFLIESTIIAFFSMLAALFLFCVTNPFVGQVLGRRIPSFGDFPVYFLFFPLLFVLLIGFIAGVYPAFVLSSLKSVESLKGKFSSVKENVTLRKSLIAFQFLTATVAFVGAIIISKQTDLFFSNDLGYNKDFVLSAQVPRDWTKAGVRKMENMRDEFATLSQVQGVSLSFEIPDGNNSGQVPLFRFGGDSTRALAAETLETDENYCSVYKIPLLAGSFFEGHALDSGKVVINEAAAYALGWKNAKDAVGQQIRAAGDPTVFTVKAIASDFHFGSMQQRIPPIIMFNVDFSPIYRFLSFKINGGNVPAAIDALQKKWSVLMPGAPFEYKFMDETLSRIYKSEIQLKKAAYTATVLALIIVLLGVLGLISLNIQKRTKEIGIRKVLGASIPGIVLLFVKEFLLVILIGGLIGCPLAYIIMARWLENYAYRIQVTPGPFIAAVLCLGLLTALLISLQTMRAAADNPVKSLRTE